MEQYLSKLKNKQNLSFEESKAAFEILMDGKASEDQIFDFLTLLSAKGEVANEIAGGVYVLRNKSKRVNVKDCVDTCGTGGDGMNTLNISTASALLLSSMGVKVAKHGNKAVSSKCGSGDVLEALNIRIDLEPNDIEKQINNNKLEYFVCDVTNDNEFKKIVENVISKYGRIDLLVNNAYGKQDVEFKEITKKLWNQGLEISLNHYFTCIKEVSPYLLKAQNGSIINISSIYGTLGTDQRVYAPLDKITPPYYSVAKGGILQMTKYFSTLWAKNGIRVNAISPGVFPPKRGSERLDYMHELTSRVPMGRIGQPKDLEGVVILLASDASSYITGQNIIVDGGWSVW